MCSDMQASRRPSRVWSELLALATFAAMGACDSWEAASPAGTEAVPAADTTEPSLPDAGPADTGSLADTSVAFETAQPETTAPATTTARTTASQAPSCPITATTTRAAGCRA